MKSPRWFSGLWAVAYGLGTPILAVDTVVNLHGNLALGAAACVGTITSALLAKDNIEKTISPHKEVESVVFRPTGERFFDRAMNFGKAAAFMFGGGVLGKEVFIQDPVKLAPSPLLLAVSFGALAYGVICTAKAIRPELFNKDSSIASNELRHG